MSLVAYGSSSDDSEEEISPKKLESFATNKKQKVKISIPSLKEFEAEENEMPKKKLKIQSGAGLLGLLPPPKNTSTLSKAGFIPHILKSKKEQSPSVPLKKCISENNEPRISSIPNAVEHDSDDETCEKSKFSSETVSKDFFSLDNSKKETSGLYLSEQSLEASLSGLSKNDKLSFQSLPSELQDSSGLGLQHSSYQIESEKTYSQLQHQLSPINDESQNNTNYSLGYLSESAEPSGFYTEPNAESDPKELLLNDERFLRLQGRRHKVENVDIIDVNGAELLTDKNQWLMKSLTEESTHRPSRKKHDMPTQQQKRKHQITYLAFQAKEREMDLKNQWALNGRTRRETQAKYGF